MSGYGADRLDASITAGSQGCACRSGVDCEAREVIRIIGVRRSQAHLF